MDEEELKPIDEAMQDTSDELDALLAGVCVTCLAIIAERCRNVGGLEIADLYALSGEDMKKYALIIGEGYAAADKIIERAYEELAEINDAWASTYYETTKTPQTKIINHEAMRPTLLQGLAGSAKVTQEMMKTSALGVVDGQGNFRLFATAYRSYIVDAVVAMKAGQETYQQAIARITRELAQSGLRVQYPSRTMELYSAVRTNVMDNYKATMSELRKMQGREFGADGVEITAHAPCAPDHLHYQGKQYTIKEYNEIQDGLTRDIETGANCRHRADPIILGVSEPAWSAKMRDELAKQSTEIVTITGANGATKEMTRYDASQYQRQMERGIRKLSEQSYLDPENKALKERIDRARGDYRRVSKEAGLTTRMERTRCYTVSVV